MRYDTQGYIFVVGRFLKRLPLVKPLYSIERMLLLDSSTHAILQPESSRPCTETAAPTKNQERERSRSLLP